MAELSNEQRQVIDSIGLGHASVQEIAREVGLSPQRVGKLVMSLSRFEPQMLHVSGANERLPIPAVEDASPWDSDGNERLQLTIDGIFQTKERVERAKRHMLRDYQEQGKIPPDLTYEEICRRYPSFWDTGTIAPRFKVIPGGIKNSA